MEILRFEEAQSSVPKRKKSSKGYLTIGFVAALFGISTAFASSTISINSDAPIALGQGVSFVTSCDTSINIIPSTSMTVDDEVPTFHLNSLQISDVDGATTNVTTGLGCGGKTFDLQIFKTATAGSTSAYTCEDLNQTLEGAFPTFTYESGTITPSSTPASNCAFDKISFPIPTKVGGGNWSFTVSFPAGAPSDISYFTLVSKDS
jgi:hypothetical protein